MLLLQQEKTRLYYSITEGKFCPKNSFIQPMGVDFNNSFIMALFVTERRNKNDFSLLNSQLQRRGVLRGWYIQIP